MVDPVYLVGAGGAIGVVCRYAVGQWLAYRRFPVGTLAVNVIGSFVLGLVIAAGVDNDIVLFVGVGTCGAFTTYSSFSVETVRLWEDGDRLQASVYAVGTLGLALVAAGSAVLLV